MAHYSEMDFLFSPSNRDSVNQQLENIDNTRNIFAPWDTNKYVIYKSKTGDGTQNIKNFLREKVYDNENNGTLNNPYINILKYFNKTSGTPGAALRIKAADLAYLRDLGVYPINRMIVLRRFPEGGFVREDLNEMNVEPISTVIGWIKPDQNFGTIGFNENWSITNERFDVALTEILKKVTGGKADAQVIPIPDFAQGLLFEFYNRVGLTERSGVDEDSFEYYDPTIADNLNPTITGEDGKQRKKYGEWGLKNIPVGDPNVLQEAPFRNPEGQNIQSTFAFTFDTTYEQKLLGDVDPGSAMLDILDNLYAMGTSNMRFYWGDDSEIIQKAKKAAMDKANNLNSWWDFIKELMVSFWEEIKNLFINAANVITANFNAALSATTAAASNTGSTFIANLAGSDVGKSMKDFAEKTLESILTSTIAIHRFRLRGSIELMVGGRDSSSPWHITIGNPYSPWLATNHIIVESVSVETSTEMGFNDQPQWLKATFNCKFSRALGKQELMRMCNNSYRRTYSVPPTGTAASQAHKEDKANNSSSNQPGVSDKNPPVDPNANRPGAENYYGMPPTKNQIPNTKIVSIGPNARSVNIGP